ncbi:MAG: copper amine oxidase N-terminal domain-containing protein [Clostridiales bacterium]|nr:copper amine oxidase N-terminal domain-containing protein [Clostridiales bacterium]
MKYKKLFAAAAAAVGLFVVCAVSAHAEADIVTVKVDNQAVEFDQNPVIIGEGYTMVPIRAVFEKAGCGVSWDQAAQTAVISRLGYTVTIKYGDNAMYKNGEKIILDAPAIMENDRIMIPVRAIAEAMDYAVTWDGHHSMVLVSTTGKPYRAYAFLKVGFRTLEDAAEFYCSSNGSAEIDLDSDGKPEKVEFNSTQDTSALAAPVLKINNLDYTASLGTLTSAYSIAVVDLAEEDNTTEIIVSENGDTLTAHFYRYENGILIPITDGTNPSTVTYASKLLISGKGTDSDRSSGKKNGYILSDLTGTCFVDIMVTRGIYTYENSILTLNRITSISSIYERNLYKIYNDKMLYHVIYTDNYTPGAYKDVTDTGVISSDDIDHFKILNGYVDASDWKYIELYIELSNGAKAVIKPYQT